MKFLQHSREQKSYKMKIETNLRQLFKSLTINLKYFIIVLLITHVTVAIHTSIVETNSGPVRGIILETVSKKLTYAAFKGIPYAEPPVGDLRFQFPMKIKSWRNVLNAVKDGNPCLQWESFRNTVIGSEDCLFLNVYTPHISYESFTKSNLKAVMVWIYGGGFNKGTSSQYMYGPDFLLEDDVIVVAFNYRLGVFGFLNLECGNSTANAGLKDQNLALKWIYENIEKFGGDPTKITLFGQSAGGASVDYHVLSDMSTGLFNRSISMSGSPLNRWAIKSRVEVKARAFALGSALGINTKNEEELLRGLVALPADQIMKTVKMIKYESHPMVESVNTSTDKVFISKCSIDKYTSGKYNNGLHMMGFTSNEALMHAKPKMFQNLGPTEQQKFKTWLENYSDEAYVTAFDTKQKLLYIHNEYPIYYYRFSYNSDKYSLGVGHWTDTTYLFYIKFMHPKKKLMNPNWKTMSEKYVRLVTNFAKYGNPTPNDVEDSLLNITWPDSGANGLYLEIDKNFQIGPRPVSNTVKMLQSIGYNSLRIMYDCN